MCGCSPIGPSSGYSATAGAKGTPLPATSATQALPANAYFTASVPGQLPTQSNVNDGRVRNAALAERSLDRLKAATANLSTPAQAAAAGYHPNPSAPDHWINDSIFAKRNGYDLEHPATLMFEGGKLVGVMLSHNPQQGLPPDLGAGSWHTHGGTAGEEYASHVWFNKPLQSAFGTEVGDV